MNSKGTDLTKNSQVPVLITWDVDPDRWATLDGRRRALNLAMDLCEAWDIRSTFFITAEVAHEYPNEFQRMHTLGQEIGCHGLTHGDEEEYDRMPEAMQRTYIEQATGKLQAATGEAVRVFRSPRVKISAVTLRLLAEYGYVADTSVCSQRLDLLSSNLINPQWLLSPRRPYHPHYTNPFKRGDLPLWEIPVSALALPFIDKALNVLGASVMKMFFRLLHAESKYTGKPIVYLIHPTGFIVRIKERRTLRYYFNPKIFSPRYIRTHGFLLRNFLLRMDGQALSNSSRDLFSYMASFPDVTFMTVSEYVAQYL